MQTIIVVTVPFFLLVFCGWLAAKRHILPESAIPGLNAFVLYFALPSMLFRFGMNTPIEQLLNPSILAVWFVCAIVVVGVTIGITRGPKTPLKDASFGALVAAFPNTGFMGVPLLVALIGEAAAGPMITAMLVDMLFTTSLCVGLAQAHATAPTTGAAPRTNPSPSRPLGMAAMTRVPGQRSSRPPRRGPHSEWPSSLPSEPPTTLPAYEPVEAMPITAGAAGVHVVADDGGARAAVIRALKGALSNPMAWAVVAGAIFSMAGIKASGPLYTVVSMLADAASPVALFTIGAVLWRAQQHAHTRTPMSRVMPVVAIKLLLHPLLMLMVALAARRLGAPLSLEVVTVLVLTAALPSASNVSILAERFGADNGRIARIIMMSTVLAFLTFTLLAWLFDVRPRG